MKKRIKSSDSKIKEEFEDMEAVEGKRHKSISRVSISSTIMGVLFFVLTLIWAIGPEKVSFLMLAQLIMAIPLLFVATLSYSKLIYRSKTVLFDKLGWYTTTIGTNLVFNAVGLMVASYYIPLAYFYFLVMALGIFIFYAINTYYKPNTLREELFKYLLAVLIILVGGIYPIIIRAF